MADVKDRDKKERELAKELGQYMSRAMARLLEALGDPPRIENLPPDFWDTIGEDMVNEMPPFYRVFISSKRNSSCSPYRPEWIGD